MIASIIILMITMAVFAAATIVLAGRFKKAVIVKHIPAIISFFFAYLNWFYSKSDLEMIAAARMGMVVLCGSGFLASLVTGVVIEIKNYKHKKKQEADK